MKAVITVFLVLSGLRLAAQNVSCNWFCVTEIKFDTVQHSVAVTISMTGTNSVYVNYPYVTSVTSQNGDTIGKGMMNFFIQSGGTSQTYLITSSLTSIPQGFKASVHFRYNSDTCNLAYPCTMAGLAEDQHIMIKIFPNPAHSIFNISSVSPFHFELFNSEGRLLKQGSSPSNGLTGYTPGLYFLVIKCNSSVFTHKLVVE